MKIVGIGAGGPARVVLDILQRDDAYTIVGLLDKDTRLHGSSVMAVKVLGDDSLLPELCEQGVECAFVGIAGVGDNRLRQRLFELVQSRGLKPVHAIHPDAVVSASSRIGLGVTVAANAVVGPEAELGNNVIVNTGAIVEHNCRIGDHVHVATGALLAGDVKVEAGAHVGIGATIKQGLTIGEQAVVGAAAAVIRDVPAGVTVVGVPAQILKKGA